MSNKEQDRQSLHQEILLRANRGMDWGDIATGLGIERSQVRAVLLPRVTIGGPCSPCFENHAKAPVQPSHSYCVHYGQTFTVERGRVRPLPFSQESHLEKLRAEAGPAPKSRRKGPEGITAQESDGAKFIRRCRRQDSLQFIDPSTPE